MNKGIAALGVYSASQHCVACSGSNSEKLRDRFLSGSAILIAAPLYVSWKKPARTVEFQPTALQRISNRSAFVLLFNSAGRSNHFEKILPVFCVLASFYKFHWTSKLYAALIKGNRFLGVQILIIGVVFGAKTVTLWQPAKAQDIAKEFQSSTVICC